MRRGFILTGLGLLVAVFSYALVGCGESEQDHHTTNRKGHTDEHSDHGGKEAAGHGHDKASTHDGQVVMTAKYHFEVLFHKDGVHVYLYDAEQKAASFKGVSGTLTLEYRGGTNKKVALSYVGARDGASPDYLEADVDLSDAKAGEVRAVISFKGLKGQTDPIAVKYTGAEGAEHGH